MVTEEVSAVDDPAEVTNADDQTEEVAKPACYNF